MPDETHSSEAKSARRAFAESLAYAQRTERTEDLERCIADGRRLLALLDPNDAEHGMTVAEICSLMGLLWTHNRSDDSWTRAVEFAVEWRKRIEPPDWRACLYILAHGLLLFRRALATGMEEDVVNAIRTLEGARARVQVKSGVHGTSSAHLAALRLLRFSASRDPLDLESCIRDAEVVLLSGRSIQLDRILAAKTLAQAYLWRFEQIDSTEDVDAAIRSAKYVLENQPDRPTAAECYGRLGSALRRRFRLRQEAGDLDAAIEAYHSALALTRKDSEEAAMLTDNLGNCFAERYRYGKRPEDLNEAIVQSRRALEILPAGHNSRAHAHSNLAFSLIDLARLRRNTDTLDEAIASLQAGLGSAPLSNDVTVRLHNGMAQALFVRDALENGTANLDQAIEALERSFSIALSGDLPVRYRLVRQEALATVSTRLVGALVLRATRDKATAARDLWRALAIGEAGKVVLLTQELLRRSLPPPEGVDPQTLAWEAILLARMAALDAREMASPPATETAWKYRRMKRRKEFQSALQKTWAQISAASPAGAAYVEKRRRLPEALIDALDSPSRPHVLISMLETTQLASDAKWVSGMCMLALWPESTCPEVVFNVAPDPTPEAKAKLTREVHEDRGSGLCRETWPDQLAALITGRRPELPGRIALSVSEDGTGLPWHVVFEKGGWTTPRGTPVPVTQVPSFALLTAPAAEPRSGWLELRDFAEHYNIPVDEDLRGAVQVFLRYESAPSSGPLVVGNPTADLDASSNEAIAVGEILGVKPLVGGEATIAAVRAGFATSPLVHIAAHARFDASDPLQSSIRLADGDLTAEKLIGEWSRARLVVLSACQSGADQSGLGGELVGFASALLRSGVETIVASLWSVDDAATRMLMTKLHSAVALGVPVARALTDAMSYVRQQPGWDVPYYWAPFIVLSRRLE